MGGLPKVVKGISCLELTAWNKKRLDRTPDILTASLYLRQEKPRVADVHVVSPGAQLHLEELLFSDENLLRDLTSVLYNVGELEPSLSAETRASILATIAMVTSIHIPKPLLDVVDRKARALKMSRNRLIVRALERELTSGSDWSPGFFEQLKAVDAETAESVDELLVSVRQARRSKPPRRP